MYAPLNDASQTRWRDALAIPHYPVCFARACPDRYPRIALEGPRASFEAGFKEDEGLYATYIALLMSTEPDRERVLEVLSRWRRDYPVSQRRLSVEARLEQAGVL